ncbi:MAG: hypothetical protein HY519_00045 [Candidatus Aenigmarchaeota archaeon]|nr:hypothetical protein [Candidatus Aenigmarchaeota archaeon]
MAANLSSLVKSRLSHRALFEKLYSHLFSAYYGGSMDQAETCVFHRGMDTRFPNRGSVSYIIFDPPSKLTYTFTIPFTAPGFAIDSLPPELAASVKKLDLSNPEDLYQAARTIRNAAKEGISSEEMMLAAHAQPKQDSLGLIEVGTQPAVARWAERSGVERYFAEKEQLDWHPGYAQHALESGDVLLYYPQPRPADYTPDENHFSSRLQATDNLIDQFSGILFAAKDVARTALAHEKLIIGDEVSEAHFRNMFQKAKHGATGRDGMLRDTLERYQQIGDNLHILAED